MKSFLAFCFVFSTLIASSNISAQTASDYYQPIRTGNKLIFHTTTNNSNNWASRATIFFIEPPDTINGKLYNREKGTEILDSGDTTVFHVLWIRKDSVGNIFMHAYNDTSSDLNSAIIVKSNLFPNEFLNVGYLLSYNVGSYIQKDSVISVTANVSVPAGNFNNCIEISEQHIDSTGAVIYQEFHYYAYGIGMVQNIRTVPATEAHTDQLQSYIITGLNNTVSNIPSKFYLEQNYPNPFNPSTVISYQLASYSHVSIKVYDILGNEVAELVNEEKTAGNYSVNFNASKLASGVYFYQLRAGSFVQTKKLILMK